MPTFATHRAQPSHRNQAVTGGVPMDIMRGCLYFWRKRDRGFWPAWVESVLGTGPRGSGRPIVVTESNNPDHCNPGRRINKVLTVPPRPEDAAPDPFFDDGAPQP